jgi:peptidoglycan/LPS O-acetylase OafA/YrhL
MFVSQESARTAVPLPVPGRNPPDGGPFAFHDETCSPAAAPRNKGLLLSFEGLRGLLALIVCLGHLGFYGLLSETGVQVRFGLAVDIFFAMSGFVLSYTSYFGRKSIPTFLVDRFARLYPLYFVTMAAMWVYALGANEALHPGAMIEDLLWLRDVGLPPDSLPLNTPSWSISVEVWMSILFMIGLTTRRKRITANLCLVLLAAFVPVAHAQGGLLSLIGAINLGVARGLAGFGAGAIAYLVYEKHRTSFDAPAFVSYLFVALLAAFFILPSWTALTSLTFYATIFMTLLLLASNDDKTVLRSSGLVFLGSISYSLYLIHYPVYTLISKGFGEIGWTVKLAFVLPLILLLSGLSARYFERPLQGRLKELARGSGFLRGFANSRLLSRRPRLEVAAGE